MAAADAEAAAVAAAVATAEAAAAGSIVTVSRLGTRRAERRDSS